MKKISIVKFTALLLCFALAAAVLGACTKKAEEPETLSAALNIGTLMGPTGMGMAPIITSAQEGLNINVYESPDQCVAGLLNGDLDIAAIPSNLAAVLYNKTEGGVQLVGVNTGGVLYVASSGVEAISGLKDLEGKTLYASGMGGVPEFALKALLKSAGADESKVDIIWMNSHADVTSTLLVKGGYALMPEPQVSVALSKSDSVAVALDINSMWEKTFGYSLPMGVIACRTQVAEERPADVEYFLEKYFAALESLQSDPEAAAETIAAAGIVPAAGIAKTAMPRCNIMLQTEYERVKAMIEPLYDTLFENNPASLGGKRPGEGFYFAEGRDLKYSIELIF